MHRDGIHQRRRKQPFFPAWVHGSFITAFSYHARARGNPHSGCRSRTRANASKKTNGHFDRSGGGPVGAAQWRNLSLCLSGEGGTEPERVRPPPSPARRKVRGFSTALRPPFRLRSGRNDRLGFDAFALDHAPARINQQPANPIPVENQQICSPQSAWQTPTDLSMIQSFGQIARLPRTTERLISRYGSST